MAGFISRRVFLLASAAAERYFGGVVPAVMKLVH